LSIWTTKDCAASTLKCVLKSLTHIKNTAKIQGFDDRISFEVDGNFDWDEITAELAAVSLFSPKRIIECRLSIFDVG
jgi:DNA polymerase-3 subunit delta